LKTDLALHIDEAPWKIQNKDEKDGYMWVISNRTAAYYFFKPTRSGQVLKEKLGQYKGPAVTDGFSGCGVLEEIEIPHAFCWAHARREFLPLENHDPTVKPILDLIDKLFEVEGRAKTFEKLILLRLAECLVRARPARSAREFKSTKCLNAAAPVPSAFFAARLLFV
jgi:hypothetical protein